MFQTFGIFVALAFAAAYWAYGAELRRKEAMGLLHPVQRRPDWSPVVMVGLLVAKLFPVIQHYRSFAAHPSRILLSGVGNWWMGLVAAVITAFVIRLRFKPAMIHPYQMMPMMLFYCGIAGFAGAVLFHHLEPGSGEGLTFYGGLLCGTAAMLFVAWQHRISFTHMTDMGSPALMAAYGIGRLGCHFSGDGDWGIVNHSPAPFWMPQWLWAYQYPGADAPVFPTSLYEGVVCILLFFLLWRLRLRITTPGKLFAIYCFLNGTERVLVEQIKINPVYSFGLTQAEVIGILWIITGIIVLSTRERYKQVALTTS